MSRLDKLITQAAEKQAAAVEAEVQEMAIKPDDIPNDVWELIQENGALATQRLNEILSSPRFTRLRAGDQAKLIALAQNRAYGMPKQNTAAMNGKNRGLAGDVTASELRDLAARAALPEYKRIGKHPLDDIEDAILTE
jgi:hypothetical protein